MYDKYIKLQGQRVWRVSVVLLLSVQGNRLFKVHRLSGRNQGNDGRISGWLGEDDAVIFRIRFRGVVSFFLDGVTRGVDGRSLSMVTFEKSR